MVALPSDPLGAADPEFQKIALETGKFTYGLGGTTVREKLLQVVAHDVCRHNLGLALRLHLTAANMHGIPYADILALVRFVAPYSGYPAAADALSRVAELAGEVGLDTTAEPAGTETPETKEQPDPTLATTDEWLQGFVDSRTSRAWSETRLSRRERAFVVLTTDVTQRTLGDSFVRHLELALASGATADDVMDALRFTAEMGLAGCVQAIRVAQEVLAAEAVR